MTTPELGYNAKKEFQPVGQVGDANYAFAVSSKLLANSVSELIAYAKARSGQLTFATQGRGSTGHLIIKLLEQRMVAQFAALMSDEADIVASSRISPKAILARGRPKALAVAGDKRSPMLRDTPAMNESGYPAFAIYSWSGVFVPRRNAGANHPEPDRTRSGRCPIP